MPLNMLPPDKLVDTEKKYNPAGALNDYTTHMHRSHISPHVKSRKYLKEMQVEACLALHHAVSSGALRNPKAFFVYKPLITLMTLGSHTGNLSIYHVDGDRAQVAALGICWR